MKFLFPQFLWALSVLSIPVIIHLFNFRRFRKVIFPNLRFLEEVEIQNKSKRQLKKWLVLAARLLAFTFLVFAFARPYFPGKDEGKAAAGNLISIYIDNSFSMNAEGADGELLEQAKNKARELAKAYGPSDRFQLLTNNFEAKHQRLVSSETFLQWVDEVTYSPASRYLSEVLERQKTVLRNEQQSSMRALAFQISDFQRSVSDIESMQVDSTLNLYLIPLQGHSPNNLSIDSVWLEAPYIRTGMSVSLKVLLRNNGDQNTEGATITLEVNGTQKGLASFDLEAGTEKVVDLSFTPEKQGWNQAVLSIQDHPLVFDDRLFFSFEVKTGSRVLHITGDDFKGREVAAVFGTDTYFGFEQQNARNLDYSTFSSFDLIVVEGVTDLSTGLSAELKAYAEKGGSLFLIPSEKDVTGMNQLLGSLSIPVFGEKKSGRKEINRINTDHPIYQEIIEKSRERTTYPELMNYYSWQAPASQSFESLLATSDGEHILGLHGYGKGKIYLLSLPLSVEWSGLSRHFLFPSTLLQAGFRSNAGQALYYTIGTDALIPLYGEQLAADAVLELESEKGVFIPEKVVRDNALFMQVGEALQEAGNFRVRKKGEDAPLRDLSMNFDRKEGRTETFEADELEAKLPPGMKATVVEGKSNNLAKTVQELDTGTHLWKLALLFTLLFVAIEILLLRFLKT